MEIKITLISIPDRRKKIYKFKLTSLYFKLVLKRDVRNNKDKLVNKLNIMFGNIFIVLTAFL